MDFIAAIILATLTTPEQIGTNPSSMLWLLPLAASIAIVYKATKVRTIKAGHFVKESAMLFGSIIVFIVIAALILCIVAWFVTEQLPALLALATS